MKTGTDGAENSEHLLNKRRRFGRSTCFLCCCPLRSKNRSDEHVFPKWLLERFNLWNQRLTLLNKTEIPYKQLTIPCCKKCNNEHLSQIESLMRAAAAQGPNAVAKLNPVVVYLWLGKIFYGLLYREYLLREDRKRRSGSIIPRAALQEMHLHHYYLQGASRRIEFPFGIPGSVFIFGTLEPDATELQFDFLDHKPGLCLAIRMGSVGLVCSFQDGGILRKFHDSIKRSYYRKNRLHPIQFRELATEIIYKSFLMETPVGFLLMEAPARILVVPNHSVNICFREWKLEEFCRLLKFYLGENAGEIYTGPNCYASSLRRSDGQFLKLNPNSRVMLGF